VTRCIFHVFLMRFERYSKRVDWARPEVICAERNRAQEQPCEHSFMLTRHGLIWSCATGDLDPTHGERRLAGQSLSSKRVLVGCVAKTEECMQVEGIQRKVILKSLRDEVSIEYK
jgi:hypothetical protein